MLGTFLKGATAIGVTVELSQSAVVSGFSGSTSNINSVINYFSPLAVGDFIVIFIGVSATSDLNITCTANNITLTEQQELYANSSFDANLAVYTGFATTALTSSTFTIGGTASADNGVTFTYLVFKNVDTTTPLDVAITSNTTTNTILATPPSITPITNGSMIVAAGFGAHNNGAHNYSSTQFPSPTFLTNNRDTTNDATMGVGYQLWDKNAFMGTTFSFSGTNSTSFSSAALTLALRPA
jgi:hypothetical protein